MQKGEGGGNVLDTIMILTTTKSFFRGFSTGDGLVLVSDAVVAGVE